MNKNQVQGHADEDKVEKHRNKNGTVLGRINDDSRKEKK